MTDSRPLLPVPPIGPALRPRLARFVLRRYLRTALVAAGCCPRPAGHIPQPLPASRRTRWPSPRVGPTPGTLMNAPSPNDALLDGITQQLDLLAERLLRADAQHAAQILARIVDVEHGAVRKLADLVSHGSRATRNHAADGVFPAEAWLAFGRASNTLAGLCGDLGDLREPLERIGRQSAVPSGPPKTTAFVARGRHR